MALVGVEVGDDGCVVEDLVDGKVGVDEIGIEKNRSWVE
jgi:hypothetical protein